MKLPLLAASLAAVYVVQPHPLVFVALAVVAALLIRRLYLEWDDERTVRPTGIPHDALYRDEPEQQP